MGPASCHVAASDGTIGASTVMRVMRHRCAMGRRKAADEAALRDLQEALQVVVEAAARRADPDADPTTRRRAIRDLRMGIERVRRWRRPRPIDTAASGARRRPAVSPVVRGSTRAA